MLGQKLGFLTTTCNIDVSNLQLYNLTSVIHLNSQVNDAEIIAAPKKKKIMKSVFYTMENGHAMADFPRLIEHLRSLDTPGLSEMHDSYGSEWMWAELIAAVLVGKIRQIIAAAVFFGLSVDSSEAVGHIDYESVVVYHCNSQFQRVAAFAFLLEVGLNTDAAGHTNLVQEATARLEVCTSKIRAM